MKVYCDTSVLVAASILAHPHHLQSAALLHQIRAKKLQGVISAHGVAEFYAVITRVPPESAHLSQRGMKAAGTKYSAGV